MTTTSASVNQFQNSFADQPGEYYNVPESIIEGISKYIEPIEINLFQNQFGTLPLHYVEVIESIRLWVKSNFERDGVDCNILTGIMFELHAKKVRIDEENARRNSRPSQLLMEVDQLLMMGTLHAEENLTLDGISILCRTKALSASTGEQITVPVDVLIKSQKLLNAFQEFIQQNKNLFEEIKSRELSVLHNPQDKSFKDSRNVFKKLAASILKKYFDFYLSGQVSDNKISLRGGLVLDYLQLLNFNTNTQPVGKELRTKLISNFKSAIRA